MVQHSLLDEIEAFLVLHGIRESTFGRATVNDWKLIRSLRAGRRMWPENEERVRAYMASYVPSSEVPAERTVGNGAPVVACDRSVGLQRSARA